MNTLCYNLPYFQLKFGPERIQKESCLSLVITAHFFFIIASDVALVSHNCYMAKYVMQTIFLVWSVLLYLTFLHAGYKVNHLLRTMPSSMLTRDNSNAHHKGTCCYRFVLSVISYIQTRHIGGHVIIRTILFSISGIMQLAMLAPYSNLATSVAAALVPTLLGPKIKNTEEIEPANANNSAQEAPQGNARIANVFFINEILHDQTEILDSIEIRFQNRESQLPLKFAR